MNGKIENICEIVESVKTALEKDGGVLSCRKFQANKSLQIRLCNGKAIIFA